MPAKRSSSSRRPSGGSSGGGGGFGAAVGKLILYTFAAVGVYHVGGQVLPHIQLPGSPEPSHSSSAKSGDLSMVEAGYKRRHEEKPKPKREVKEADASDDEKQSLAPDPAAEVDKKQPSRLTDGSENPDSEGGAEGAEISIQEKKSATPPVTRLAKAETKITPKPGPVPAIEIDRGATKRKEVALTFDAGSDWKPVRKIVDTLTAEGITTTFFLTGEWVQKNPKSTKLIAGAGHEIGNHSWNHPSFTKLSDEEIRDQLKRTEDVIQETAGHTSRPYFRPPLGARDPRVRKVVSNEGYLTVYWTLDSRDSVDKGITAEQIRDRVLSKADAGSIVLLHCGSQATADALPEIVKGLKAKGLTPVSVSRLLQQ